MKTIINLKEALKDPSNLKDDELDDLMKTQLSAIQELRKIMKTVAVDSPSIQTETDKNTKPSKRSRGTRAMKSMNNRI